MPGRRLTARAVGARRAILVAALLGLTLLPASGRGASATVTISGDGSVALTLTASIPNGSIVREAMDGNFTPIVDAITTNASERTSLLSQISAAESTPFLGSLFGNRDGTVEPGEVTSFESLLQYEATLLPTSGISGGSLLAFTLDGGRASSAKITSISFSNATGPADSTAPLGVTTGLDYVFSYSGGSHTLALTTNVSTVPLPIALLTGSVGLEVVTPAGTSITGTAGFAQATVNNDLLGWGTSSVSGSFEPTSDGVLSVSFGPAFPTGDVLLVAPVLAIGAVAAVVLLRRRAKRRAAAP